MKYNIDFIINLEEQIDFKCFHPTSRFKEFLLSYTDIQNSSTIPIFSNSTKYNNKNKKMYKNKNNTQCIFIRNSCAWVPNSSSDFDKKIKNSIISNLNKLSTDNFNKISDILICDLKKDNNENITNVFCHELLNKNIYDKDYQDEYVRLCIKICSLHTGTFDKICRYKNKFYIKESNKFVGPFDTNKEAIDYNKDNLLFKKVLLNKLYNKFMNRSIIYDEIISSDDTDFRYKKKREIFSIVEFICKLFNKGVIDYKIIYMIHISLLNINCTLDYINLNIEILYNMWNILSNCSLKIFNLDHINNIYTLLFNKFDKIQTNYRIKFFIEHLINTINNKFRNNLVSVELENMLMLYNECKYLCDSESDINIVHDENISNENIEDYEDVEEKITDSLKKDTLYSYISRVSDIEEYLDTLIYVVLNNSIYMDKCIQCLNQLLEYKLIDKVLVEKIISHSDEDIEEMMLDNNKVSDNFNILKDKIYSTVIAESY